MSYYNGTSYTFTWDGRRLVGATKGSNNLTFVYNSDGLRTSKTVNGATITYLYDGTRLIAEYAPGYTCVYIYDESGSIIGARYISTAENSTWQTYFFEKNLQGDVIAVYSGTGTKLISYRYDAWGNTTTAYYNGGASTLAANNSITYRGYYFDKDLGMYYLQSRYYDAKICRFINADGYVSTGQGLTGYNMFAYCNNNPVKYIDPYGELSLLALFVISTVAFSVVAFISSSILDGLSYEDSCGDALVNDSIEDYELEVLFYDIEVNDITIGNASAATDITATIGGLSLTNESNGITSNFSMLTAEASLAMFGAGAGVYLSSVSESTIISILGKEIAVGWEANTGIGFECKVGPKTELGLSILVGGSLMIDWDP